MEFYKQILPVVTEKKDRKNILKNLSKNYHAVFESANDVFSRLGVIQEDDFNNDGDLYFDGKNLFYVSIPEGKNYIEAGALTNEDSKNDNFEDFKSVILSTIMTGKSIDSDHWKNYNYANERFNLITEEAFGAKISEDDKKIVMALSDIQKRNLLKEIASRKNCFIESLSKTVNTDNLFDIIEALSELKLVNREYFVYCRKNGLQISKYFNLDSIQEASAKGLQCPHCGKTHIEEKIEQDLSPTFLGSKFTKSNFWLALYTIIQLEQIGINQKSILIREESEFKNVDIFINYYGKLIYLSIKENELSAHDAYMFKTRVQIYKADTSVLITSKKLKNNDKTFILAAKDNLSISIIEENENIKKDLIDILEEQKINYITKTITDFEVFSKFDIGKIIADYFFKDQRKHLESIIDKYESDPVSQQYHPAANIVSVEDKISPEDSEFLIEEVINAPRFANYVDEVQEIEEEKQSFELEENINVTIAETETEADTEAEQALSDSDKTLDEGLDEPLMIEENINVDFSGIKDLSGIPEIAFEDKIPDDKYYDFKTGFKEFIESHGLCSHWTELDGLVNTLTDQQECIIASPKGLPIFAKGSDKSTQNILSAYSCALFSDLSEDFSKAVSIFIDSPEHNTYIDKFKDYVTIVRNKKDASKNEAFNSASNHDFRESVLKNLLEELEQIDGIIGSVLLDGNMQISGENLNNDSFTGLIQSFVNEFIKNESGAFNKLAKIYNCRQICIFLEDYTYSFIPLEDGAIFSSVTEASSTREVWNLKMIECAKILA